MTTPPEHHTARRPYTVATLLLSLALLGGCGEFAYKRGASASDLEAAKKVCQARSSDPAVIEKCLADQGWFVQSLDRLEPVGVDPVIDASVIPADTRIENAASTPPRPNVSANPAAVAPAGTAPAALRKKAADPMDRFKISSWWKIGSNAAALQADTEACVSTLGEAHRPDAISQQATRALLVCMKGKGWSGLRAQ